MRAGIWCKVDVMEMPRTLIGCSGRTTSAKRRCLRNRSSEFPPNPKDPSFYTKTASNMIRAAFFKSTRCASRSLARTPLPTPRAIAPCLSLRSTGFTPVPRCSGIRSYSAPAGLSKPEVEGRIIDILKNFDKVGATVPRKRLWANLSKSRSRIRQRHRYTDYIQETQTV